MVFVRCRVRAPLTAPITPSHPLTHVARSWALALHSARVFCVFEHEKGQRACLEKLSNGLVAAYFGERFSVSALPIL